MKHRQVNRPIAIAFTVIMFICMALITFGCAGLDPAARYAKEHSEKSWEHSQDTWMNDQIEQVKAQNEQDKDREKKAKELAAHKAKLARIKN